MRRATSASRSRPKNVADGVWFLGGGSHNSAAIEMADHLIPVNTSRNDARTPAVVEQVKSLVPGKPMAR